MPRWSRDRRYAIYLKNMQEKNFLEARILLDSVKEEVAFDEAVAVCAIKDVAHGLFLKTLQNACELSDKEFQGRLKAFRKAKSKEDRQRIFPQNAFEDAMRVLLDTCSLVWQIEGLPADFLRCLPLPNDPLLWEDAKVWDRAILEYLHPADTRRMPLARQAWEERFYGKKFVEKND